MEYKENDWVVLKVDYLRLKRGNIGRIIFVIGDGSYRISFDNGISYVVLGGHQIKPLPKDIK